MKRKLKVICACGAAIAQSTMMAVRIEEECKKRGIEVDITKCVFSEVKSRVETIKPDFVFTAGKYADSESLGVPYFDGFPIITGIGYDETIEKFFEEVKKLDDF